MDAASCSLNKPTLVLVARRASFGGCYLATAPALARRSVEDGQTDMARFGNVGHLPFAVRSQSHSRTRQVRPLRPSAKRLRRDFHDCIFGNRENTIPRSRPRGAAAGEGAEGGEEREVVAEEEAGGRGGWCRGRSDRVTVGCRCPASVGLSAGKDPDPPPTPPWKGGGLEGRLHLHQLSSSILP